MKNVFTLRGLSLFLGFLAFSFSNLYAQTSPTLSVQGILKKSNGVAVDDGAYSITFKLYKSETGGTAIWTETQPTVEVSSGIYSATLGTVTPLTVPFDTLYFLGVTVGSTELTPRVLLTSAPYALSLIGQTNKFPSAGTVQAEKIAVAGASLPTTHSVVAVGGYLARGGAPGLNGAGNNGYAFDGNSGDKDSGLFSTADGEVSLYANNTEVLEATPGNVAVTGNMNATNVGVNSNGSYYYNGLQDWRLVDVDYLEGGNDGWQIYGPPPSSGNANAWNNGSGTPATVVDFGNFAGKALRPTQNYLVFKKGFAPPGGYTYIKVKFRYFFLDTWGFGGGDQGWAAFAPNASGTPLRVGWAIVPSLVQAGGNMGTTEFQTQTNFANTVNGFGIDIGDFWTDAEMTAYYPSSNGTFWVMFGAGLDQGVPDENFAVGMIEIWVK
ncbi:MAG: hypothetical protein IPM98_11955 [Lewinellaceae bacterium]|nr:hypothetical protein [Lewinellaceae bacterium]